MTATAYQTLKSTGILPSPTGVALELLRLSGDEKATLDAIAAVVEADPALAGRILKLVNSSFAGLSRRVTSLSVAVRLLGLRTVKNLALGISLVSNHRKGQCQAFDYERFWSESFARAVAARCIAEHVGGVCGDEAFTTGLLAEVGCLALATVCPREYARVLSVGGSSPERLRMVERQAIGIDHNQLSAELMLDWRVEPYVCEAVRCQGEWDGGKTCPEQARPLARVLHLASGTAAVQVGARTHIEALTSLVEEAGEAGIARDAFSALFDRISGQWRETGTMFSVCTWDVQSLDALQAQAAAGGEASESRPAEEPEGSCVKRNRLRILVVDDDPAISRLASQYLTAAGYEVLTAGNGEEALEIDRARAVDMVITDWMMPEMDGIELCRQLRSVENRGFIYAIVLVTKSESGRVIEALNAGVDDVFMKPFDQEGILAHVRVGERIVRLESSLAERSREIAVGNAQLAAANERLRALATTDELTGLMNRRQALERLRENWSRATESGEALSCIVADIDRFKQINDTYGHAAGDTILKETAGILGKTARSGDLLCRIGGEEFLVICSNAGAATAQEIAERMRSAVGANPIRSNGNEWFVSVSMGVAERAEGMTSPLDLLKAADRMLHAAKQAGRNRVCVGGVHAAPSEDETAKTTSSGSEAVGSVAAEAPAIVLVVDDDPLARSLSVRLLEREGYVVHEAEDGGQALERAAACRPNVIVLDSRMPIMDGLECARRLKAEPATMDIPIIMLSAADQAEDIEAGLEAGVDEYLTKPLRAREFTLRVRSMARLQRSKADLIQSNHRRWEQARTLQTLLDLSVGLTASGNLDSILQKAVAAAAELTHCRRVSIMMPDMEGTHLTIAKHIGLEDRVAEVTRVPLGQAIAGEVFASGSQIVINRPEEIGRRRNQYDAGFFVSAPLLSKALRATRRVVGVLNVTDRQDQRPFEASELESLDLLCNVTATAIDDLVSRQERNEAQDSIVVAMATLAEYRDTDTASHLERVTRYASMLAGGLREGHQYAEQIDGAFLHDLRRAMPLHDIGKIAVPDRILLKPGKLTPEEMTQMKRHAEDGARTIGTIIKRIPNVNFLKMAEQIAWCHHEKWDGTGYPRGLAGQDIPLVARIAAVADVYDALTTRRVYKVPFSHERALAIMGKDSGTHFDPAVIQVLLTREHLFAKVAMEMADECPTGATRELAEAR